MSMLKINQISKSREDFGKNYFDEEYENLLMYFLNPDIGNKKLLNLNHSYVADDNESVIVALKALLREYMDSIDVLVGYQGIGKSTDIRYSYQIMNNAIRFDEDTNTIIFPSFFYGFVHDIINETSTEIFKDVRVEFSKKIGAICDELERINPEISTYFSKKAGKEHFFEFFRFTNPKALVNTSLIQLTDIDTRLLTAQQNDFFIYIATKLKFYLSLPSCKYNRILIILDDVESLPKKYQAEVVSQYIRFYFCMRNFPDKYAEKDIYIKLLISIRPYTYKNLNKSSNMFAENITREIYKTHGIDMVKYFEKKFYQLPQEIKSEKEQKVKEIFSILLHLSSKFDKKYSNMIQNLVYWNFKKTLKIYRQILLNNTWIVKNIGNEKSEYIFNNITVIRALACGNNVVYFGEIDNLIPNIFFDTKNKENSILGLYVIAYFVHQHSGIWKYGETTIKDSSIYSDFIDVFGEENIKQEIILEILRFFYDRGILDISIFNEKDKNSEGLKSLYLTSRGWMIWNMLAADSVLMELYREDYYLVKEDEYSLCSSFELMQQNKQIVIFYNIYKILIKLFEKEEKIFMNVLKNGSYNKYLSIFGSEFMVEHLMVGVDMSIEYSGNAHNSNITPISFELKDVIDKTRSKIV